MSRPLRIEYEGAVYHIIARGNERKKKPGRRNSLKYGVQVQALTWEVLIMVKYIAMVAAVVIIIVINDNPLSTKALAGNSSLNTSTTKTKDDVGKDINHEMYDVYAVNIEKGLLNVREIPSMKSRIIANLRPRNCVLARKNTLTEKEGAE